MRAPKKVIAAMAMATLLGGTVGQAFADSNFITNVENGKPTSQTTEVFRPELDDDISDEGKIVINGKFTKKINSFPDAKEEGRYLRVTMPLELNYEYNVDTKEIISPSSSITNESVLAKRVDSSDELKQFDQPVVMTFMGLEQNSQNNIQYVEATNKDEAIKSKKVQVPFGLVVTKGENDVQTIPLANMVEGKVLGLNNIRIGKGASIGIKIGKINNEDVVNLEALEGGTGSISHNMKLRFEYDGE